MDGEGGGTVAVMKTRTSFGYGSFLLAAALLGAAGCFGSSGSHPAGAPAAPAFADGALDDYLPPDAGAVYTINPRQALETPAGRRLAEPLRRFLEGEKTVRPWLDSLGADPLSDVDRVQFIFSPPELDEPLVLLKGRFDASRLRAGRGALREASEGPFRFYEAAASHSGPATDLAPVGDVLAVSPSRPRLLAALNYAAAPRPVELRDAGLRDLLREVNRDQGVWLAVSFKQLGPVPRLTDFGLETVLRPVLRHAESVQGGVRFGDEVRGEFVFRAATEAGAGELDQDLQAACEVAQGAYLLPGVDPSLLPLLRLLGTGTTHRDGRTVTLRCAAPADRLAP